MADIKLHGVGHITKREKAQREQAEKALQQYPELTGEAPGFLNDTAKKEWYRIIPLLKENTPISELDVSMIATHCTLYATTIECTEHLNKEGIVVETDYGQKQSPYFMAYEKAVKDLRSIDSQLGLTPQARVRLEVHKATDNIPKDKFEAMLS